MAWKMSKCAMSAASPTVSVPPGLGSAPRPGLQPRVSAASVSRMVTEYRSCMVLSLPLLLQPHLFQKQVGLVIEAMIFHPLAVGLVEGVTADVHPRHLFREPALDVGADLLALLGLQRPSPVQDQRLHLRVVDPHVIRLCPMEKAHRAHINVEQAAK